MSTNHYEDSPASEVLAHVVDVHCHPTDSVVVASVMDSLPIKICAMSVLIVFKIWMVNFKHVVGLPRKVINLRSVTLH
jgi:hypothetical protein